MVSIYISCVGIRVVSVYVSCVEILVVYICVSCLGIRMVDWDTYGWYFGIVCLNNGYEYLCIV